ncbi:hatching enzyme 1.2-like [Dendropsophus ebraccatus]|uniref:hatching enzyme 1.2-like n=1 Tax=Dendropsophus ebraccatus TaxID=150705 RepID=UPI003831D860
MELGFVLLCLSVFPLSQALPMRVSGGDEDIIANEDNRTVTDIIMEVNQEADIILTEGDIRREFDRSAKYFKRCLWPKSRDGLVRVPYVTNSPSYKNFELSLFVTAMKEFEVMTCIRFVNRTNEPDYLSIENGVGCWSYIGKIGGKQTVSLSMDGCITYSLIQHELMHNLGFYHEHTRNDRDDYIDIMWDHIASGSEEIYSLDNGNTQDISYDYMSILHYTKYAYSTDPGLATMLPKSDPNIPMGEAIGLSNLDVMRVNSLYSCNLCRQKLFTPGSSTYDSSSGQGYKTCLYLIQSTIRILLQLSDINVPSSPGCSSSYIKVYDGVSQSSPVLLDKTCGRGPVPPLISSGKFMLIEIVNNQLSALSRFIASYQTVRYGGTYGTYNGKVTSPKFPFFYPNDVDLVYSIVAPKGYTVSLTFRSFEMDNPPACSTDYVRVIDGSLTTSPILGTYCGVMYEPLTLVSTGNVMLLQFRSEKNNENKGFSADYNFVATS